MENLKGEILALRTEGNSYREISNLLNCSKATISYYCSNGQKEKTQARCRKRRKSHVLIGRLEAFKAKKSVRDKADAFQRRLKNGKLHPRKLINDFGYRQLVSKIENDPRCYLTGRPINLTKPKTFQLDHIIPASKGGGNTMDNLGIVCREANLAKADMSVEEFVQLCKEVLQHRGYKILG